MLAHLRYLYDPDIFRYLINITWAKWNLISIKRLNDDAPLISSGFHINRKMAF